MFKSIFLLPRTVWLIGLISFVNDSSSEMVYPLIPIYLSSVLMGGPKVLGIIEGIAEATASLLKLFSGVIVDRTHKVRSWIILGYGLAGITRPLIALANSWFFLLILRFSDRVGKGLRTSPRDTLLAASVAPEHRGLAFGLHRAMDNGGAVVGPILAYIALTHHMALKSIFLLTAIPAIICLALAFFVKDTTRASFDPKNFDWKLSKLPEKMKRYLVVVSIFTLGNSSNMFLLLRAKELGFNEAFVPLLWATVSFVAMIFSTPLAALSDKIGRVPLLACGYFFYGVFYFILGELSTSGWWLFLLFGSYGVFMAATEGVEKAFVADVANPEQRGTAFGWFNLVTGAFLLPASILFGWLYQGISPFMGFLFSSLCAFTASALLLLWFSKIARKLDPTDPY